MKIGVQSAGIQWDYSVDETYRIVHEAGFDAMDVNINELFGPEDVRNKKVSDLFRGSEQDCLLPMKPWRDAALKYHVDNYQAHAPFPSMLPGDPEYNDYLIDVLKKTIACCDYLGCRHLVIHPFYFAYPGRLSPEQEWEINIDRYSRLIPQARKYGVTLCLENMWSLWNGKGYSSCCGTALEACRYVDELNRIAGMPCFGFCLDTGHLILGGQEIYQTMLTLGKRIRAFHVHDNNGVADQHLAPYLGVMDWDRFIRGLAEIGFDQTMSFETYRSWTTVDPGLRKIMLQYICQAGRIFAEKAESLRRNLP